MAGFRVSRNFNASTYGHINRLPMTPSLRSLRAPLLLASLLSAGALTPAGAQGPQRVYLNLVDSVAMSVPAASAAVAGALARSGWVVLADHPVGTDRARCGYAARVLVMHKPSRAALLARAATAPYAIPVRLGVFQDERGVHVSMVNPLSIDRTVLSEPGLEAEGRALIEEVASAAVAATHGRRATRPYGQERDRALIGKTMGVMAGGPFPGQVETIATLPGGAPADLRRAAEDLWVRLQQPPAGTWQLRGVYRLDLSEQGVIVLGVSGAPMEAKAFGIVGAGDDASRDGFRCPGIAYAPAFPLELVLRQSGGRITIDAVNAMFRMKMYFEDAGRMKFARNMAMPGSIADELRAAVRVAHP